MSTSFLIESTLDHFLEHLKLKRVLITEDEHAHDAEYRLVDPNGNMIFQGGIDRCSDFVRGCVYGQTGVRVMA